MNILAVGAHPDDLEILCAGTLAKYAQQGHQIAMAIITNGDMGDQRMDPLEVTKVRKKEAEQSAHLIGAKFIWIGIKDELLTPDLETRMKVVDAIREAGADLVVTHAPNDYHPDHRYTSQLVFDALPLATLERIPTTHPAIKTVPKLYYMDTAWGCGFISTRYVDISKTFEVKRKMLSQHQSQIDYFKYRIKVDLIEQMTIMSRYRGIQCGVRYAEAFRHVDANYQTPVQELL